MSTEMRQTPRFGVRPPSPERRLARISLPGFARLPLGVRRGPVTALLAALGCMVAVSGPALGQGADPQDAGIAADAAAPSEDHAEDHHAHGSGHDEWRGDCYWAPDGDCHVDGERDDVDDADDLGAADEPDALSEDAGAAEASASEAPAGTEVVFSGGGPGCSVARAGSSSSASGGASLLLLLGAAVSRRRRRS